uniref:cysteine dioxygenase n=1 Tax=Oryza sativa subsp. japonica TaxID=39947 RepID=Q2QNY0_ORYSJ|nr:hypothetical protein LOC_Os12g36370 [Oryza sativa Japonica Group]
MGACLRHRRLVSLPTQLAYYATVVGRLRLHPEPASVTADWCPRLYGWLVTPPFMGVHVFIDRPDFTTADCCPRLSGWLVTPPFMGVHVFTDRLDSAAAYWCFRLHGRPIMPPLSGVHDFTAGLPPSPPTGVLADTVGWSHHRSWEPASVTADWCFRLHGWPLCRRCWASTSSPTGLPSPPPTGVSACTAGVYAAVVGRLHLHRPACLRRCRLVFPPARLAFMPPLLGVYVFTDRLAFTAADWCFRLHGWPLCRRCWASTSSPTGLPSPLPTGVSACTAGLYAAVVGRLRLHRPAASSAADWCFRLHGWPLCRRCWASTSSPTGRLDRRRLVFPPARLAYYAAVVGRLRLHRPAAASAADWCHRLHGWPVITPTDAIFFTAGYIAVTTNRH